MAQSPTAQGGSLAVEHPVEGCPGPSRIDMGEEIDTNVEIVEEGKEGKTSGLVPTATKGNRFKSTYLSDRVFARHQGGT
jgi:hypothetical protein